MEGHWTKSNRLCLLEADWSDSGYVPVNSQAQADGATDTEMPKRDRTVCMARVQLFIGACAVFPPHVYISESFWFALLFVFNVSLCLWFERSTFCLVSIQESRSSRFRESKSSVSYHHKRQGSRGGPSLPCAARQLRLPYQHYIITKALSVVTLNCLPLLELMSGLCSCRTLHNSWHRPY